MEHLQRYNCSPLKRKRKEIKLLWSPPSCLDNQETKCRPKTHSLIVVLESESHSSESSQISGCGDEIFTDWVILLVIVWYWTPMAQNSFAQISRDMQCFCVCVE